MALILPWVFLTRRCLPLFWFFFVMPVFAGVPHISLHEPLDLTSSGSYFVDTTGEMGLEEARQENFQRAKNAAVMNIGYERDPVWIKLPFEARDDAEREGWYLDLGSAKLSQITLFHVLDEQLVSTQYINDELPFNQRTVKQRQLAFNVALQKGNHQLFLKVNSRLGVTIKPLLMPKEVFTASVIAANYQMFFFLGAIFILVIYNFLIYLSTREYLFLTYIAVIFTTFCWLLSSSGLGFQYFWPDLPSINPHIQRISVSLVSTSIGVFTLALFKDQFWNTKIERLLIAGILITSMTAFLPVFKSFPLMGFMMLMASPIMCAYIAIEAARRRIQNMYYFSIAWVVILVGFGSGILRVLGIAPSILGGENIGLVTVLTSVLVLSQGLAVRINEDRVARNIAEASAHSRSLFLANMSHEIRTPMNAVLGFNELIMSTDLDDEQRIYADKIRTSSKSLLGIINDILDFSKMESGEFKIENRPVLIRDVLKEITDMFEFEANRKALHLILNFENLPNVKILGDELRLRQVLINLVGNAIKFTAQGQVTVEARLVDAIDDDFKIHFSVQDSGIGIEQSKVEHLFTPFSQADSSTTRLHGGTGLGLSISSKLVEKMGGTIAVESTASAGSNFHFELSFEKAPIEEPPIEDVSIKEVPYEIAPVEEYSPKTAKSQIAKSDIKENIAVLLVEDNEVNQLLAKTLLRKNNMEFAIANNGSEALEVLEHQRFDVVLMDVQMPVMDGYEATRAIRERLKMKELPIIAMTANAMDGDREQCLEAGMNDYITKPINSEQLFKAIHHWTHV